ncbi:MAG: glycerol kinase GlpK [Acidobacteriota bacterium]|nr:glycerol kinase GlpK [Bryobacteraceae bacterium CoA2 C42]
MRYILSLDEGTTSARAALYNREGHRLAMASVPIPCRYPQPGWVEQDAAQIWTAQLDAMRRTLAEIDAQPQEIAAVGITNQRETTVVWDRRTGAPIAPAIVWQCRRTAERCRTLAASAEAARVTAKTGLVIDAYFSGSKVEWILDHTPGARERAAAGDLLFGNIDTWLIWNLTAGSTHVTDPTNASRTMLMDLATGDWDDELLALFGIPRAMLPRIVPSSGICGQMAATVLGVEIPIAGIAGDQQAALAGQACFRPGLSKNTYGTGCFALLHTGGERPVSRHRLLGTRAANLGGGAQFAVEGSIFIAGAAVQWLRDKVGLIESAPETEQIAQSVAHTGGVYLVPAFVGLGAPHWDAEARASLTGMTLSTGRAELVRATLESMAYQTRELVQAMEADSGAPLEELRVDGGAAQNNFLMQFQADMLGCPVVRPRDSETTALGAAYLAGLAVGYWSSVEEVESFWQAERVFTPSMAAAEREALWAGWQAAVARTRSQGC